MAYSFNTLVTDILMAVDTINPGFSIQTVLTEAVSNSKDLARITPDDGSDGEMLFENEHVSIWWCRFESDVLIPPHDHCMDVFIAGYAGAEKHILFTRDSTGLHFDKTITVHPGEIITMNKTAIHSVIAENNKPACSIHVYMGPLSKTNRNLFEWDTGTEHPFTQEKYDALIRPASAFPDY